MKGKDAMNGQCSRLIFVFVLAAGLMAGCAAPQATAAAPTATALAQATIAPAQPTTIPATATRPPVIPTATAAVITVPPAPKPPASAPSPTVKMLMQSCVDPDTKDLWLEFTFPKSEVLSGDVLSQSLETGTLEIIFPDGSVQAFDEVPPAPKDATAAQTAVCLPEGVGINNLNGKPGDYFLSEYTFENYSDSPHGPQIRVPLEEVMKGFSAGAYQLSWHSTDFISEGIIVEWDGNAVTDTKAVPS